MAVFSCSEELYNVLRALFDRIKVEEPDATRSVLSTKLTIRLKLMDPDADIFINGKKNPLTIDYGSREGRADLELDIPADMFHEIMLGELTLKKAFASGWVKLRGPIWKSFALGDIFQQGQAIYPVVLDEFGIGT